MSLIPAFEIGVWNAWILTIYFFMVPFLVSLKYKDIPKKCPVSAPLNKTRKKFDTFMTVILILALIYSIFLPLKLGTIWFYTGLSIFLLGAIMYTIAVVNFGATPLDKPVTKGLYRYSRHPMYLTEPLIFIGAGIASASWIFLLFSILFIINSLFVNAIAEEHFCLEKYGDTYREYMERTPRWIGIPKS
jgi:protein-S-isoprenylcysteine O-methyltransferase Ste14